MAGFAYESFVGFRLQEFANRLRERGTIIGTSYSQGGIVTFTTETGHYSLYCEGDKPAKRLTDGRWKLLGDFGRWAYLVPSEATKPGGTP